MNIKDYLKSKNVTINNEDIYLSALTHPSYKNEHSMKKDYEKLEFLGDAIIEVVVTKLIYDYRPELNEGDMTVLRSALVRSSSLANYARKDKIYNLIRTGNSISKLELKNSDKYLEDVFEALMGAIWIDSGIDKAEEVITSFMIDDVKHLNILDIIDYKSKLQEIMQNNYKVNVFYITEDVSEQTNIKKFKSSAYFKFKDSNVYLSTGFGSSKKESEKDAAKKYLEEEGYLK